MRSRSTPVGNSAYSATPLTSRIAPNALARAQALADQFGQVDLRTLVADELLNYGALEGERFSLNGPAVGLSPRAGQVLALAIHELAVNAVEHGRLGTPDGRVEVAWTIADTGATLPACLTWTETGGQTSDGPLRRGFGTEVLTRMLPYECHTETEISFGADGLRCAIRFSTAG